MLVDIATAKGRLRIDGTALDSDLLVALEQASSIVLDYLKVADEPDPVPEFVQAATLLAAKALLDGGDPLSDVVMRLLHRYRDPTLA